MSEYYFNKYTNTVMFLFILLFQNANRIFFLTEPLFVNKH